MKATPARATAHRLLWPFLAGWLCLVVAGFTFFERYQNAPGTPAQAPAHIATPAGKPRLLVFLHPQCPCSRATVSELAQIATESGDRLSIQAYILAPTADAKGDWMKAPLVEQARAIPGVEVVADPDGQTARRFGVQTSGEALLYAPGGALTFSGGITASRGHEGENVGHRSVVDYAKTGKVPTHETPVFGCALFASQAN